MADNWLDLLQNNQITKVIETNKYTEKYGLSLSEQDAELIIENKKNTFLKVFFYFTKELTFLHN